MGEASNEDRKSAVLDSIKQDLKADEVGDPIDGELSVVVNSLLTKRMADDKLQEEMNRIACPQNCEALTKMKVSQLIWSNLSAKVRSQDLCVQKVQTSLIKVITGVILAINKGSWMPLLNSPGKRFDSKLIGQYHNACECQQRDKHAS